jgi:HlyD family type I secretion membrane fusion protein
MNGLAAGGRLQQSQAQKDALRAAEARLIAERDRSPSLGFPSDLASRSSEPTVRQAIANQTALFESRKRVFDAERQISEARVQQARARAEAPSRQLVFVRDQLAGMRALYEKGFATKARLYDLERMQIELETNNTSGAAALAEARLVAARDEQARMGEVIDQLRQVQSQLSQVDPQVAVARYNAERDVVRAPVAGAVVGMQDVAAGGILSPGQRIADLLPAGRALIVEARIKPEDVDDVRVGSEAHVRFTTVNPRGRSNITGRVTVLSADRLTDPATGTAYYLAYIALDGAQLERDGVQLSAGLPATVNIKTKSRSFLNYLLAPLMDSFSKAGREE